MKKVNSRFTLKLIFLATIAVIVNTMKKAGDQEKNAEETESSLQKSVSIKKPDILTPNNNDDYNLNSLSISFKTAPYKTNNFASMTFRAPGSYIMKSSMISSSVDYTFEKVENFCSTKVADFFNGASNNGTLWEFFNNKSIFNFKEIGQRLFENVSLSKIYGGRSLFSIKYLSDNTTYTVKGFQNSQFKYALRN